jgi:hypothetical protein
LPGNDRRYDEDSFHHCCLAHVCVFYALVMGITRSIFCIMRASLHRTISDRSFSRGDRFRVAREKPVEKDKKDGPPPPSASIGASAVTPEFDTLENTGQKTVHFD